MYVEHLINKVSRLKLQLDGQVILYTLLLEYLSHKFYLPEGTITERIKQKTLMTFGEYVMYYRILPLMEVLEKATLSIGKID